MQNSDYGYCFIFNSIEDEMFTYGVTEIPFSDVVAVPPDPDIPSDQMKGLVQSRQVLFALLNTPISLGISGYIFEVSICLVGKLKSHLAVQLGR